MKILYPWKLKLRKWQQKAFEKVAVNYEQNKDFLCVATPGAGKTIFALRVVHHLFMEKKIKRVVILCPTEHLKKQWAESAAQIGIDINPEFENAHQQESTDYWGVSLTYAQVGRSPVIHKRTCDSRKTLVIFDEIHHLGDNLSWGDGTRYAFEKAAYRLSISGTPFRRDANPIPFVKYKKFQSMADFTYGYSDAIIDNVCRPVFFPAFEGEMEWRVKNKVFKSTFGRMLNQSRASERLRTALDPDGKWLKMVIKDANSKLDEIRDSDHKAAGGLIITIDQSHARRVASLIERLTGTLPTIVVSDDPKASKKIAGFNKTSQKWLVAVKMVSEGVDIPRLRVGVYASNIKSELFFRQAVGRFVRTQKGLKQQDAFFYIPKDIILVEYAKQIEIEREHYIGSGVNEGEPEVERKRKTTEPGEDSFEAIWSIATKKTQLELDFGSAFALPEEEDEPGMEMIHEEKPTVVEDYQHIPVYEQIERLKDDIKDLSRRLAMKRSKSEFIDWNLAHKEWLKVGGKPIHKETMNELQKRKKWLRGQLNISVN
ncbi:MAG: DEAD/DEAH box helicase [Melioribacteraceae bacterium]|nr:DEAD/DEAH box helicase [Melioribacteraceae bacterium]